MFSQRKSVACDGLSDWARVVSGRNNQQFLRESFRYSYNDSNVYGSHIDFSILDGDSAKMKYFCAKTILTF